MKRKVYRKGWFIIVSVAIIYFLFFLLYLILSHYELTKDIYYDSAIRSFLGFGFLLYWISWLALIIKRLGINVFNKQQTNLILIQTIATSIVHILFYIQDN